MQHDVRRLGHGDRRKCRGIRPEPRRPDLPCKTLDGHARALLGFGASGADHVDPESFLEHGEHARRGDSEDGHGDEEIGEVHEGKVAVAERPVNARKRRQLK